MSVRPLILLCLPAALLACDPSGVGDPSAKVPDGDGLGGGVGGGGEGGDAGGEGGPGGGDGGGGADGGTGGETGGSGGETGDGGDGDGGDGDGADGDFIRPGEPGVASDGWYSAVDGTTWALDLSDARIAAPAALAGLADGLLHEGMVLQARVEGPTAVRVRGAAVDASGGQDLCLQTGELEGFPSELDSLYAAAPVAWVPLPGAWPGAAVAVESFEVLAYVSDSGELYTVELAGRLNLGMSEAVVAHLLGSGSPEEVCLLMASFGASCTACADGREACMDLWVTGATGAVVDLDLVEVEAPCP